LRLVPSLGVKSRPVPRNVKSRPVPSFGAKSHPAPNLDATLPRAPNGVRSRPDLTAAAAVPTLVVPAATKTPMADSQHRASTVHRASAGLRGLLLGSAVLAAGCYTDDDYYYDPMHCEPGVEEASIDTGGILILDPGRVGATAEYLGDGAWRFATACDTALTGVRCNWRIRVAPLDGVVRSFAPETLEVDDELFADAEGGVNFDALSDIDLDAFTLETTPGATVRVHVALDGACGGPFFFWLEDEALLAGVTPSVELTPSEP
jgi:hypothetical protein